MSKHKIPVFELKIDRGSPNVLVLVRGLPGTGKTTFIRAEFSEFVHYEADMYHMVDGRYEFSTDKLKDAHRWCRESTLVSLNNRKNVAVSNTFTTLREIRPYLDMPFDIWVFRAEGNYQNVHDVPNHVIDNMRKRWTSLDDYEAKDPTNVNEMLRFDTPV